MHTIKNISILSVILLFIACKSNTGNAGMHSRPPWQRIDLFKENPAQYNEAPGPLSADSAFSNSRLVAVANSVWVADSSRNRSDKGDFYLYAAVIDTVLKGEPLKKNTKLYFTSCTQWRSMPSVTCTLYLLPWAEHRMIKRELQVQWQWLSGAPFSTNPPAAF